MKTGNRVVVIGGGIAGCAAALQLARSGYEVHLLERSTNLGGLVVSFSVGGTPMECFYHHVFPNERHMVRLINELGLGPRFEWRPSTVGILTRNKIWPFTSATDLLRFEPLPAADRIRTGLSSLRLTGPDRKIFDRIQAREWLHDACGDKAMEELWNPLLAFKFGTADTTVPASWMAARFRQRASARTLRGERLGYLRGGFKQLFDALATELERLGAHLRTGTSVDQIELHDGSVCGVTLGNGETIEAPNVLFAGQLPGIDKLIPAGHGDARWSSIGRLGAICIVLELRSPISDVYWTNVCQDDIPFGALIEHTNLVPASDYDGRHVVYLGRYFTEDDPVANSDLSVMANEWIDSLARQLPSFRADDVIDVHPFRTPYASPLVTMGYRRKIPPIASHIRGLFVATTAQIYPEDRGMNEGVKLAGTAVRAIMAEPARTPKHRSVVSAGPGR
jgi:protoporphyrinogen oxidase